MSKDQAPRLVKIIPATQDDATSEALVRGLGANEYLSGYVTRVDGPSRSRCHPIQIASDPEGRAVNSYRTVITKSPVMNNTTCHRMTGRMTASVVSTSSPCTPTAPARSACAASDAVELKWNHIKAWQVWIDIQHGDPFRMRTFSP